MVKTMFDFDLHNKRLLIREDFNVPLDNGKITSAKRLEAAFPTIKIALENNAKVMAISHLGRPKEGEYAEEFSLLPVANWFSEKLGKEVRLVKDWLDEVEVAAGELVICENVRFNVGEKKNDDDLAKKMAALCDIFVMDAFASAHRAQASTHGVAKYAPIACAGPLLKAELDALGRALQVPVKPMLAVVGGSKVSTKLIMLEKLLEQVDQLIVGGGIANTFLQAAGFSIGKSLTEEDLIPQAKRLIALAKQKGAEIPLPVDVVVAKEFSKEATATVKTVTAVADDEMILDIGPKTSKRFTELINQAQTIVWNGPVGVFEFDQFAAGTKALATAIADSKAFSLAGGGDTLAAIDKFGIVRQISYVSTGGGAFLEFLQGETLPAVAILDE